jgi:flagellar motor switch protein FliN/FliY
MTQALVAEIGDLLQAALGEPVGSDAIAEPNAPHWTVRYRIAGPMNGTVLVGFDLDGGRALAQRIVAADGEVPEAAVSETLLELAGQALAGLAHRPGFAGLRFTEPQITMDLAIDGGVSWRLTSGDTSVALTVAADAAPAAASARETNAPRPAAAAVPANLDVILDIELPLTVRFGETSMTLGAMTELASGSIIDLQRAPDAPVDVLVNGRIVARGEVVVVGGNYGVRITHVMSNGDRARMAAA